MDPNEIARLVEELDLEKEAKEAIVTIDEVPEAQRRTPKARNMVVGKVFASRVVNRETLRTHIPRILQTRGDADIEIVGDNIFAIIFSNPRDRDHTLYDGPWHFFNNLLLFREPCGLEKATDVRFTTFTTWIQCHNIPLVCMNPAIVRKIGEAVGKVEEIDTGEGGNCIGTYARIRVTREVDKTLQRCVQVRTGDANETQTILIRYERLPEYCMACGRMGHNVRNCQEEGVDKTKQSFGPWLKATRTVENRRGRGTGSPRRGQERTMSTGSTGNDMGREEEGPKANVEFELSESQNNLLREVTDEEKSGLQMTKMLRMEVEPYDTHTHKQMGISGKEKAPSGETLPTTPGDPKQTSLQRHSGVEKKKAWKRLARTAQKETVGNGKESDTGIGQVIGRKRRADWKADGEEDHNSKQREKEVDIDTTYGSPAVAAKQPRREQ